MEKTEIKKDSEEKKVEKIKPSPTMSRSRIYRAYEHRRKKKN